MFLSRQLSASGNAAEAAALLAAIGEAEQAVLLLLQHGACREACLLAQHSSAVSSQVRCDAWVAMAALLQTEGKHAAAAEAFACAGDIGASIECLERVGTLKSLVLAGNLVVASLAIQPYKTASLVAATMQQRQVLTAIFACAVLGEDYSALTGGVDDDGEFRVSPPSFAHSHVVPGAVIVGWQAALKATGPSSSNDDSESHLSASKPFLHVLQGLHVPVPSLLHCTQIVYQA